MKELAEDWKGASAEDKVMPAGLRAGEARASAARVHPVLGAAQDLRWQRCLVCILACPNPQERFEGLARKDKERYQKQMKQVGGWEGSKAAVWGPSSVLPSAHTWLGHSPVPTHTTTPPHLSATLVHSTRPLGDSVMMMMRRRRRSKKSSEE